MSWIWSFYFICLFFSLAAKLIGARTGRQFFKNVDFFTYTPLNGGSYVYGPNYLNGQRREFHIWNNAQKTKENYIKMILSSLAYITPIRLSFCISTGERGGERENFCKKKKKKKKRNQNWSETILQSSKW